MIDTANPEHVASALLAYLRDTLGTPALEYAGRPARVLGGNRTFVYGFELAEGPVEFARPLILRIARPQEETKTAQLEAAVQAALFELGYPVARILVSSDDVGVFGSPFQIMQRLPGRALVLDDPPEDVTGMTIFKQLLPEFGRLLFGSWPNVLAGLQLRLHRLDVDQFVTKLESRRHSAATLTLEAELERWDAEVGEYQHGGLRSAMAWLIENRPSATGTRSICHGDFFPNQVLVNDDGSSGVLDWGDAFIGPGEMDVGIVKAGLETLPAPLGRVGFALQKWLGRKLVTAYKELRPTAASLIEYGEAFRCTRTLILVATRRRDRSAGLEIGPNPFDDPVSEARLVGRLREVTGIVPQVPPVS